MNGADYREFHAASPTRATVAGPLNGDSTSTRPARVRRLVRDVAAPRLPPIVTGRGANQVNATYSRPWVSSGSWPGFRVSDGRVTAKPPPWNCACCASRSPGLDRGRNRAESFRTRHLSGAAIRAAARSTGGCQRAAGDAVAAFALTEPEADRTPPRCASRPSRTAVDRGYRGRRCGSRTPRTPTSTRSSPGQLQTPGPGVSAFIVPENRPGLSGEHLEMLSQTRSAAWSSTPSRSGPMSCSVSSIVAFPVAMRTLDLFRPSVGAFAIGMAQAASTRHRPRR